jgi:hypothetical protein
MNLPKCINKHSSEGSSEDYDETWDDEEEDEYDETRDDEQEEVNE